MQFESDLIFLEEASIDVSVDLVSHAVDDVVYTIFNKLGLLRFVNTVIEEIKELLERGIVHPVDENHFYNTEVEDCTTGCDWSEMLTLFADFNGLFTSFNELFVDLFGFEFDFSEHINEFLIIEQVSIRRGKSIEERLIVFG